MIDPQRQANKYIKNMGKALGRLLGCLRLPGGPCWLLIVSILLMGNGSPVLVVNLSQKALQKGIVVGEAFQAKREPQRF